MVQLTPEGKASLGSGIAFAVLASIAVSLRILSKTYTKASWAADDSWAVLGLIALYALITSEIWGMSYLCCEAILDPKMKPLTRAGIFAGGGGLNYEKILLKHQTETLENYMKSLYILHPLYTLSITATKLSILYLYRRIFAVPTFRRISFAVAATCVVWWVVTTIAGLVPCYPVNRMWQPQIEGQCYNFKAFFLGAGVVDVVLDGVILTLPLKLISRLQMPYKRKVMLCFVFLVGGFVVVTGIVRTILTCLPDSPNIELWTNVHLGTAVLCACLPTFPPLLSRFGVLSSTIVSKISSIFSTWRSSDKGLDGRTLKHYDNLTGPTREGRLWRETTVERSTNGQREAEWEMSGIMVEKTVHIV
ncbi:MAG: hypothetical protein Q9226_000254 [Calogaya cf. arnoldii]